MHDVLESGRTFRTLNVIDDYNREALAVERKYSFPAEKVIPVMERLVEFKGKPSTVGVDNGSEFIAKTFRSWCSKQKIDIQYIQPSRPMQNAYIKRFNRTFREDVLDAYIFEDLNQVKLIAEDWREDHNQIIHTNH